MSDIRAGLHPDLLRRLDIVLDRMAKVGNPMRICQGFRTAEYQASLFAQGRTTVGPGASASLPLGRVVTNCDGIHTLSNHQSGRAADCCFHGADPFGETQPWSTFGHMVEGQGLKWGGRFPKVDRPHVELPKSVL